MSRHPRADRCRPRLHAHQTSSAVLGVWRGGVRGKRTLLHASRPRDCILLRLRSKLGLRPRCSGRLFYFVPRPAAPAKWFSVTSSASREYPSTWTCPRGSFTSPRTTWVWSINCIPGRPSPFCPDVATSRGGLAVARPANFSLLDTLIFCKSRLSTASQDQISGCGCCLLDCFMPPQALPTMPLEFLI